MGKMREEIIIKIRNQVATENLMKQRVYSPIPWRTPLSGNHRQIWSLFDVDVLLQIARGSDCYMVLSVIKH